MGDQVFQTNQPTRRGAKTGYPSGDETRERIIATAIMVFGKLGFRAASTRAISSQAGVKQPALQYYFGSKLGLYRACAEAVASAILVRVTPLMADAWRTLKTPADTASLIDCYCNLQDGVIDSLLSKGEGGNVSRLLTWEDMSDGSSEAKHCLRDQVDLPVFRTFTALFARITGRSAEDLSTRIEVFALGGIFLVFHSDADRARNALNWCPGEAGHADVLKTILREQAATTLEAMARKSGTWVTTSATIDDVHAAPAAPVKPPRKYRGRPIAA